MGLKRGGKAMNEINQLEYYAKCGLAHNMRDAAQAKEWADKTRGVFLILKKHNKLKNDHDMYLYACCEYALGEIDREPEPKHYGVADIK